MKNDFREFYDENYIMHKAIDNLNEDELMHFNAHKYIDKIKDKFGKWRYIYNETKKAKKEARAARDNVDYQHIVDTGSQKVADDIRKKNGKFKGPRKRILTKEDVKAEKKRRTDLIMNKNKKSLSDYNPYDYDNTYEKNTRRGKNVYGKMDKDMRKYSPATEQRYYNLSSTKAKWGKYQDDWKSVRDEKIALKKKKKR